MSELSLMAGKIINLLTSSFAAIELNESSMVTLLFMRIVQAQSLTDILPSRYAQAGKLVPVVMSYGYLYKHDERYFGIPFRTHFSRVIDAIVQFWVQALHLRIAFRCLKIPGCRGKLT